MYCDKDSNGHTAIMDLREEEFETIRRALVAFKAGLLQNRMPAPQGETFEQYHRAGMLLRQIEKL